MILRRARGYAPGAVATIPSAGPILAVGADLKNTITLVVDGQAFVSQYIGDLGDYQSFRAFEETIRDLISMYEVRLDELLVVHDSHPQYASTVMLWTLGVLGSWLSSIIARILLPFWRNVANGKREWWESASTAPDMETMAASGAARFFVGSVEKGSERVAHLRSASLPGGDAAAQYPVQAAAGFLAQLDAPDLAAAPFNFRSATKMLWH